MSDYLKLGLKEALYQKVSHLIYHKFVNFIDRKLQHVTIKDYKLGNSKDEYGRLQQVVYILSDDHFVYCYANYLQTDIGGLAFELSEIETITINNNSIKLEVEGESIEFQHDIRDRKSVEFFKHLEYLWKLSLQGYKND